MSDSGVPAGWYDDPHHIADLRWRDGSRWSEHTSAAPSAQPSAIPVLLQAAPFVAPALVVAAVAAFAVAAAVGFFVYRNVIDDSSSSTTSAATSPQETNAGTDSAPNSVTEDSASAQSTSDVLESAQAASSSSSDDQTAVLESLGRYVDDIPEIIFQPDRLQPTVVDTIELADEIDTMVFDGGFVWVSNGIDSISVINSGSRQVIDTIAMTSGVEFLTTVNGEVWVVGDNDNTLKVIDPVSRSVVDTVQLGFSPGSISIAFDRAWITDYNNMSVTAIDTQSQQIAATIPLDVEPGDPYAVRDRTWITDGSGSEDGASVLVIDPNSITVEKTLMLGADPLIPVKAGERVFYVTWNDDLLRAVDAGTGAEVASVPLGGSSFVPDIANGLLWVPVADTNEVEVLDPSSLEVGSKIPVSGSPFGAVGFGDTVLVFGNESMVTIGARSQEVTSTLVIPMGGEMAFGGGCMWMSDPDTPTVSVIDLAGG